MRRFGARSDLEMILTRTDDGSLLLSEAFWVSMVFGRLAVQYTGQLDISTRSRPLGHGFWEGRVCEYV